MTASPPGTAKKTSHRVNPAFSPPVPSSERVLTLSCPHRCCIGSFASLRLNTDSRHFLLIPTLPARSLYLRSRSREVDRAGTGMPKGMWSRCINTAAHRGKCRGREFFGKGRFRRGGSIHGGGACMVEEENLGRKV